MNRIFLIGYMGSGKTTVGQLLATRLGYRFIDMDAHIEGKLMKSVTTIFTELGEEQFRIVEQECLHEIADIENVVFSTGGGAPCFFDNMDYMNERGVTFYLKLSPTELAQRLENSHANLRPLLAERKGIDLERFITNGLAKREEYYLRANFTVSGEIEPMVMQISELMNNEVNAV